MPPKKTTKTPVTWSLTDGKKPRRNSPAGTFDLLSPIDVILSPGNATTLDLGVKCNYPVGIYETRGMKLRGLRVESAAGSPADQESPIVLRIRNEGREQEHISAGEMVARAYVIDNGDLEVA